MWKFLEQNMNKYNEHFIDIKLNPETVYVYSVRRMLQDALDANIHKIKGVILDLGCGEMPYRQYLLNHNKKIKRYIGVDIPKSKYHNSVEPDLIWNGKKIKVKNEYVDTILATELFEHIANLDVVLKEARRVLKKKGKLIFTVPFIWPLHETPHDEYRYTPYSLTRHLTKAGFTKITIMPLGGYNASLAQMICIWTVHYRNSNNSSLFQKMFPLFENYLIYPTVHYLLRKDKALAVKGYGENTMSPGFYGYAEK